ncbi:MAG: hypothetical protein JJU05_00815 [Verrucomicrobia bacterium]|nr:hypothetical protein [Verrucomicrobiota bacterium]MCH8526369.1 immunity 70 family protein [Kiritimatiellia bacterium]
MGLYLSIFDEDEELDGVEVGSYADFNYFRDQIVNNLEHGKAGGRFPVLVLHSDCDGEWSIEESSLLEKELKIIQDEMKKIPAVAFNSEWQIEVSNSFGINPENMDECFFDIDGEPLTERLIGLTQLSQQSCKPILFQ